MKKNVSSKAVELIYGSKGDMSRRVEGNERPEKPTNLLADFWHFVTDLQADFQLFFNNINELSKI